MTKSEAVFEDFCLRNRIPFEPIQAGHARSPDYRIFPCSETVICEVKQIEPSAEEIEAEAALERGESGEAASFGGIIGKRVRQKIIDGAPQIRAHAKGKYPGVLFLWEPHWVPRHLGPYHIKAAMYGFDTVILGVPNNPEQPPYVIDRKSGKNRRVTKNQNTSLSAVAALRTIEDRIECRIYHNTFATIPLQPALLHLPDVWHYRLCQKQVGQFDEWCYVE